MITTLTLNPAVDRTLNIEKVALGQLNRVDQVKTTPGGKGINVARVLKKINIDVKAMGILGGEMGEYIKHVLDSEKIKTKFTWSNYSTRQNLKIREISGRETEINESGKATKKEFNDLLNNLEDNLNNSDLLVMGGSLPEGFPIDSYKQIIDMAHKYNVKTLLDTSGKNLTEGLKGKPFLIKPNLYEVENFIDKKITNDKDLIKAGNYFINQGVKNVVISLGSKGAVLINEQKNIKAVPPKIKVKNTTVGAGDTMVAGICYGIEKKLSLEDLITFATSLASYYVKVGNFSEINFDKVINMKEKVKVKTIKEE